MFSGMSFSKSIQKSNPRIGFSSLTLFAKLNLNRVCTRVAETRDTAEEAQVTDLRCSFLDGLLGSLACRHSACAFRVVGTVFASQKILSIYNFGIYNFGPGLIRIKKFCVI